MRRRMLDRHPPFQERFLGECREGLRHSVSGRIMGDFGSNSCLEARASRPVIERRFT